MRTSPTAPGEVSNACSSCPDPSLNGEVPEPIGEGEGTTSSTHNPHPHHLMLHTDVLIIGAGLAGLTCARHIRHRSVTILRPTPSDGASYLASGGIAAAIGEEDSPEIHISDTIMAADGLAEHRAVQILANEGVDRLIDLIELSVGFDRDDDGVLQLGREALHSHDRIVHVAGDETGLHVTTAVRRKLEARSNISFVDGRALELIVDEGQVCGTIFTDADGTKEAVVSPATVLATGGVGALYAQTTNPPSARAEGLAMALRAGATMMGLEFIQFHPTALVTQMRPQPLLSEAIRGEGATLVDGRGHGLMTDHPRGDLAGRDVIARRLWRHLEAGHKAFLDARSVDGFHHRFPAAYRACRDAGLQPKNEPLPVTPAAHYHMGGICTDCWGRTSLPGLWAVGEVASTGVHGANRLASNSLLEALVFGARAGRHIATGERKPHRVPLQSIAHLSDSWRQGMPCLMEEEKIPKTVTQLMWRHVGIERNDNSLREALERLNAMIAALCRFDRRRLSLEAARAITRAALERRESRGAHFRIDYPGRCAEQHSRQR